MRDAHSEAVTLIAEDSAIFTDTLKHRQPILINTPPH